MQILVDSSVWIEYVTGAPSSEADYLYRLLGQQPLVVADVVMAEVLHGLPDEVHRRLQRVPAERTAVISTSTRAPLGSAATATAARAGAGGGK